MKIRHYRYGEAGGLPGLKIGVTRHVPRGVRKEDRAARGLFDVWMPLLAPSTKLLTSFIHGKMTFAAFAKHYRTEMKKPEPRRVIELLAAVSIRTPIAIGCFCEDPKRCHRTLLLKLLEAEVAEPADAPSSGYASPACSMPEIED